jgi:hypothetical protein
MIITFILVAEAKTYEFTEGSKVKIFVPSNSAYPCLPSPLLVVPGRSKKITH